MTGPEQGRNRRQVIPLTLRRRMTLFHDNRMMPGVRAGKGSVEQQTCQASNWTAGGYRRATAGASKAGRSLHGSQVICEAVGAHEK